MSVNTQKHQEALKVHYILSPTGLDIFEGYLAHCLWYISGLFGHPILSAYQFNKSKK